jgi:hypothetical protein
MSRWIGETALTDVRQLRTTRLHDMPCVATGATSTSAASGAVCLDTWATETRFTKGARRSRYEG